MLCDNLDVDKHTLILKSVLKLKKMLLSPRQHIQNCLALFPLKTMPVPNGSMSVSSHSNARFIKIGNRKGSPIGTCLCDEGDGLVAVSLPIITSL